MPNLTGGSFKRISPQDIVNRQSNLNQLVDVVQEDVSGSATRKKYQVFVTGGVGPGVTSSLFQTVYDQDFSLQTANPIFDMTVGLYQSGTTVTATKTGQDSTGKLLFSSQSLMSIGRINKDICYSPLDLFFIDQIRIPDKLFLFLSHKKIF